MAENYTPEEKEKIIKFFKAASVLGALGAIASYFIAYDMFSPDERILVGVVFGILSLAILFFAFFMFGPIIRQRAGDNTQADQSSDSDVFIP